MGLTLPPGTGAAATVDGPGNARTELKVSTERKEENKGKGTEFVRGDGVRRMGETPTRATQVVSEAAGTGSVPQEARETTRGGRPQGREGIKGPRAVTGTRGDEWRGEEGGFRGLGSEGVRSFVASAHRARLTMAATTGFRARLPLDLDSPQPPFTDDDQRRA